MGWQGKRVATPTERTADCVSDEILERVFHLPDMIDAAFGRVGEGHSDIPYPGDPTGNIFAERHNRVVTPWTAFKRCYQTCACDACKHYRTGSAFHKARLHRVHSSKFSRFETLLATINGGPGRNDRRVAAYGSLNGVNSNIVSFIRSNRSSEA